MQDKKKLLIVASTFPKNNSDIHTARFVLDLAIAMTKHYEVYAVAPHSEGAKKEEDIDGVRVKRFRYFFPASLELLSSGEGMLNVIKQKGIIALLMIPCFLLSEFFFVLRIVLKERIEIINSHWLLPQGLICGVAARLTGSTHIATSHAAEIFLLKRLGFMGKLIARFVDKASCMHLPVSSYIKSQVQLLTTSLDPLRYSVIPMGVDVDKFSWDGDKHFFRKALGFEDCFIFLFVGKFVEKKGISVLIKAVDILRREKSNFRLVLVGGGPLEAKIKEMVKALDLYQYVRFMGWIRNDLLADIYRSSNVLVVPSVFDSKGETEGMPVVINEALSCGLPVLASDISGIPDTVRSDFNGWLFPSGDVRELAQLMMRIMDLEDMQDFAKNAASDIAKNSWGSIAKRYYTAIEGASVDA